MAGGAELTPHLQHHKEQIQDMDLPEQDVVLEAARKDHGRIVADRSTAENRQGWKPEKGPKRCKRRRPDEKCGRSRIIIRASPQRFGKQTHRRRHGGRQR